MRAFNTILFAALWAFLTVAAALAQAPERPRVPELTMQTLGGERWSLGDHVGKVVVLNFWATWCEPCKSEKPMLNRLADELADDGLVVAGVSLDEGDTALVQKFVDEYKIGYTILMAEPGSPWAGIENLPTTILVDKKGRMAERYVGAVPENELRKDVEALLKE